MLALNETDRNVYLTLKSAALKCITNEKTDNPCVSDWPLIHEVAISSEKCIFALRNEGIRAYIHCFDTWKDGCNLLTYALIF